MFYRDIANILYLLSTACKLFLKLKFPKILKYKRTSVCYATLYPSSGLRFSVDCSLLFHYNLLIFSAIQLRPEYFYLLNEGARLFNKLLLRGNLNVFGLTMQVIALLMAYFKSRIRQRFSTLLTDGTVIYVQVPWYIRLLFPRGKRGRIIDYEVLRLIRWATKYLFRLSKLCVYASSPQPIETIMKTRPKPRRIRRAIRAIIVFAFQILTYRGRISKTFMRHAHACIFNSSTLPFNYITSDNIS